MAIRVTPIFPVERVFEGPSGSYLQLIFTDVPRMPNARYHSFSYDPMRGYFTWIGVDPDIKTKTYIAEFFVIPDGVICPDIDVADREKFAYIKTLRDGLNRYVHVYEKIPDEEILWEPEALAELRSIEQHGESDQAIFNPDWPRDETV